MKLSLTILWALWILIALCGPAAASLSSKEALYDMCDQLLVQALQLQKTIETDLQLEARRERNRLRYRIWDLETDFDSEVFAGLSRRARLTAHAAGIDTGKMDALLQTGARMIAQADFKLKDVQALRANHLKSAYGIDLNADYKQSLDEKLKLAYLSSLIMNSQGEAYAHLSAFTRGLRKFQEAEQLEALSEKELLEAEQELASSLLSSVPLLGDALDIYAIGSGEDPLTGKKLGEADRWVNFLLLATPEFLEVMIKKSPAVGVTLNKLSRAASGQLDTLARKMNLSALEMDEIVSKSKSAMQRNNKQASFLEAKTNSLLAGYDPAMDKTWQQGMERAGERIKELETALKEGENPQKMLEAYQELRKDKMALGKLQDPEYKGLREQTRQMEDRLFSSLEVDPATAHLPEELQVLRTRPGKVDQDAISGIRGELTRGVSAEQINSLNKKARSRQPLTPAEAAILAKENAKNRMVKELKQHQYKHGVPTGQLDLDGDLSFENLEITVFNATNKPPAPDKIGFDRDITYQLKVPEKKVSLTQADGSVKEIRVPAKTIDIPAEMAAPHYNKSLYANLNPDKPLPAGSALEQYGREMDHAVTDHLDKEAYRLNLQKIEDFFKYPHLIKDSPIEVENFVSTVMHKSDEWFQRAEQAALAGDEIASLADTAEGMRQAAKQYENYMPKILGYYGMSPDVHIAPKLKNGIMVFDRVRAGKLSATQAGEVLEAMGTSKDEVVQLLGETFESVVKFGIKTKK